MNLWVGIRDSASFRRTPCKSFGIKCNCWDYLEKAVHQQCVLHKGVEVFSVLFLFVHGPLWGLYPELVAVKVTEQTRRSRVVGSARCCFLNGCLLVPSTGKVTFLFDFSSYGIPSRGSLPGICWQRWQCMLWKQCFTGMSQRWGQGTLLPHKQSVTL